MLSDYWKNDPRLVNTKLFASLLYSIQVIDDISGDMYSEQQWGQPFVGHAFTLPRSSCTGCGEGGTIVTVMRNWLRTHEEAQVMLASVLVVVAIWWLVRTILTLFINLICPVLVVLLAVVCVPQLRAPLLGQNYPMLANLLKSILIKAAEKIQP